MCLELELSVRQWLTFSLQAHHDANRLDRERPFAAEGQQSRRSAAMVRRVRREWQPARLVSKPSPATF